MGKGWHQKQTCLQGEQHWAGTQAEALQAHRSCALALPWVPCGPCTPGFHLDSGWNVPSQRQSYLIWFLLSIFQGRVAERGSLPLWLLSDCCSLGQGGLFLSRDTLWLTDLLLARGLLTAAVWEHIQSYGKNYCHDCFHLLEVNAKSLRCVW